MRKTVSALGLAALIAGAAPASASVVIGGYTFDVNAFADTAVSGGSGSGSIFTFSAPPGGLSPSLQSALTDKSADTGTYFSAGSTSGLTAFVDLGFTDNVVVNGAGVDLVIFEEAAAQFVRVTIGGVSLELPGIDTGIDNGWGLNINAVVVNLGDFGVAAGDTVSGMRIDLSGPMGNGGTTPSILEVGALNSRTPGGTVPEPASWALAALGLLGAAATRRRR